MTPRESSEDVELLGGRKGSPVLGLSVPVYLAHVLSSVCVRNASFFLHNNHVLFYLLHGVGVNTETFFFDNVFYIYFSGLAGFVVVVVVVVGCGVVGPCIGLMFACNI